MASSWPKRVWRSGFSAGRERDAKLLALGLIESIKALTVRHLPNLAGAVTACARQNGAVG